MKLTVDTNILVRSVMRDDAAQAAKTDALLRNASLIAVTVPCLCEFVWVLLKVYGLPATDIATAIRALEASPNVAADRPAIAAGLEVLDRGGDFADGAIAQAGRWLGGETFVSFDKNAVRHLVAEGHDARLP